MASSDDLRAEYLLLQNLYEDYDKRALSLKAIVDTFSASGIALAQRLTDKANVNARTW